jgi:branched-chain amino acid transport system ATP-binding protein
MLAVGRALMSRPTLLMLNEPSLGLAPLVVEQNARAALETADYGYVLEMGDMPLHGSARDLATDPRVIDAYLGAARKREST